MKLRKTSIKSDNLQSIPGREFHYAKHNFWILNCLAQRLIWNVIFIKLNPDQ
jgi:hypothetical protein